MKAKGVKKLVIDTDISHKVFEHCLATQKFLIIKQNMFRTNKHETCTIEQNTIALRAHDDKRYILEYGIDTLAWGHNKIHIPRDNFIVHITK
jgi:hypothetical protein